MKQKLLHAGIALLICLLTTTKTNAQLYVGPVNPDIPWYTSACPGGPGVYIAGLNTAMIDVTGNPFSNPPVRPSELIVSDYYGNGTAGGVSFRDAFSGFTVTYPYCNPPFAPNYFANSPDIIVGNDFGLPGTDFRVAAAYINLATGDPQIDYFLVHYTGPGVFAPPVFLGSTVIGPGLFKASTIHLDVIADAGNTGLTGLPWCDRFIVTWDDANTGLSYAHLASLNAPPPVINFAWPTTPLISFTGLTSRAPDVAAIQRKVTACAACPVSIDPIGLFVTIEGNSIFYQEFDWATALPAAPVPNPMDAGTYIAINYPRIDAPDDYNINSPATPGLSYFKAVAEVYPFPGIVASHTFDNQTGGAGQDDGWYLGGTQGPFSPTVAYGGNNGTQYQVSHYVDAYSGGGPVPSVFMEPINWMAPGQLMANIPDWFGAVQPYFQVNTALPIFANGNYLNSISTPCNNPSRFTLCAWADHDPSIPQSNVKYKMSIYSPPFPNPWGYGFKQPDHNMPVTAPLEWKVYPSPATTELTVENPVAGRYEITDMLGRTLLKGELQASKQTIDIGSLAPGSYIISAYGDKQKDHANFVKD